MLRQVTITPEVSLDYEEIIIVMLCIFGLMEKEIETITPYKFKRVQKVKGNLCAKMGRKKSGPMIYIAQEEGFNRNGTFKGEEIFSDEMKRRILQIAPYVKFLNPPKLSF